MYKVNDQWLPTVTEDKILGFFDQYRFLSNFHVCKVHYDGIEYPSSEHLYMALKSTDVEVRLMISKLSTSGQARRIGQTIELRKDWEEIKTDVMRLVCFCKFHQNPELGTLLLNTGNKYLEETNYWNDTFWGVCEGVGHNQLGKSLMHVRDLLRVVRGI